jgi:hypothetical protein
MNNLVKRERGRSSISGRGNSECKGPEVGGNLGIRVLKGWQVRKVAESCVIDRALD